MAKAFQCSPRMKPGGNDSRSFNFLFAKDPNRELGIFLGVPGIALEFHLLLGNAFAGQVSPHFLAIARAAHENPRSSAILKQFHRPKRSMNALSAKHHENVTTRWLVRDAEYLFGKI